jgi:hypothetical protein
VEGLVKKVRRGKSIEAGKNKKMNETEDPTQSGVRADKGMSRHLQAHIGRHLRAAFDEVAREPIPDRLVQLLKHLDRDGDK